MAQATSGQLFSCVSPTVREYVLWLSEQPNSPAGDFVINQLLPDRVHLFIKKGSFAETVNLGHATSTTRNVSYRVWIREKIDKHLEDTSYRSTKERQENDSRLKKELRKLQHKKEKQGNKKHLEQNKQAEQQRDYQDRQQLLRLHKERERADKRAAQEEEEEEIAAKKRQANKNKKPKLTKQQQAFIRRDKQAVVQKQRDLKRKGEDDAKAANAAKRKKRTDLRGKSA